LEGNFFILISYLVDILFNSFLFLLDEIMETNYVFFPLKGEAKIMQENYFFEWSWNYYFFLPEIILFLYYYLKKSKVT